MTADKVRETCLSGVLTRVRNRDDAEDIAGAVFVRVWPALDRISPKTRVQYCYNAGQNAAIDFKRLRARSDVFGLELCEMFASAEPGFAEVEALMIAETVPDKWRDLPFYIAAGHIPKEAPELLGISVNACRCRISDLRIHMRASLQ